MDFSCQNIVWHGFLHVDIHEYTKQKMKSNFKLFSDSKSAVRKANEYMLYIKFY